MLIVFVSGSVIQWFDVVSVGGRWRHLPREQPIRGVDQVVNVVLVLLPAFVLILGAYLHRVFSSGHFGPLFGLRFTLRHGSVSLLENAPFLRRHDLIEVVVA